MSEMAPADDKEALGQGIPPEMANAGNKSAPFPDFNMGNMPPSSGAGNMPDGIDLPAHLAQMGQPPPGNPGQQPNPNPGAMNHHQQQQPKSHLAEILGSHEMNTLQKMSRSSDYGSTGQGNMPPTQNMNRPNNPGTQIHTRSAYPNFGFVRILDPKILHSAMMHSGMNNFDRGFHGQGFPNPMQHPAFMGSVPPGSQPGMSPNFSHLVIENI